MKGSSVYFIIIVLIVAGSISSSAAYVQKDECSCSSSIVVNGETNSNNHKYSLGLLDDDNLPEPIELTGDPPTSWDWRDAYGKNWVTPVRDQGECGSCYAFAAVAALETTYNIKNNDPTLDLDLSEQFVVSCSQTFPWDNRGCCGGLLSETLLFLNSQGVPLESCFSYKEVDAKGRDGYDCPFGFPSNSPVKCNQRCSEWQDQVIKIQNYHTLYLENSVKIALSTYGPVLAGFNVYDDFLDYNGGVYEQESYKYYGKHLVIIVGYDDSGGYWICKNSWGSGWGESGFFKIKYGECGIAGPGNTAYFESCGKTISNNHPGIFQIFQKFPFVKFLLQKFVIH